MQKLDRHTEELNDLGYSVIDGIYSSDEINEIIRTIEYSISDKETFRKSKDLFAIRQFLKEIPTVSSLVFNKNLNSILRDLLGETFFVVKSIYFDKPKNSNWYVSYHQDLTISVEKRFELEGFTNWTLKQNQFAVQPPLEFLQNIVTVRIHLDETNEQNGALKVIAKSHKKGIYRPETINWGIEQEISCNVAQGGIMLMKPLLLHSSNRSTGDKARRVIHIEFSNKNLPEALKWSERLNLNQL